jgi:hypothetical protein
VSGAGGLLLFYGGLKHCCAAKLYFHFLAGVINFGKNAKCAVMAICLIDLIRSSFGVSA